MIVVAIIAIIVAIAIPNLLRARMATNETAAIGFCKTYLSAQAAYRRTDHDGDQIFEFARRFRGNFSLLETAAGVADLMFIEHSSAAAESSMGMQADGPDPDGTSPVAKSGYTFAVLDSTFNPSGGVTAWLSPTGDLSLGHGLSARPFNYDSSGRNGFQVNYGGTIYQRDEGQNPAIHSVNYEDPANPAGPWSVSE
jgi:type II secretory pathway pseudopilin PulG